MTIDGPEERSSRFLYFPSLSDDSAFGVLTVSRLECNLLHRRGRTRRLLRLLRKVLLRAPQARVAAAMGTDQMKFLLRHGVRLRLKIRHNMCSPRRPTRPFRQPTRPPRQPTRLLPLATRPPRHNMFQQTRVHRAPQFDREPMETMETMRANAKE